MSVTIPVPRKVIGIKHTISTDQYVEPTEDYSFLVSSGEGQSGSVRKYERQIASLKNRINMLESALQAARDDAFNVGFEEGKRTVLLQVKQKLDTLPVEFARVTDSAKRQFDEALAKMDQPLLKIALKIAERILAIHLDDEKHQYEFLLRQIQQFLNMVIDQNKVTIYLNPGQVKAISESPEVRGMPFNGKLSFRADNTLQPCECVLETDNHVIEGLLKRQLDIIANQVLHKDGK